jgi:hypothetical protein
MKAIKASEASFSNRIEVDFQKNKKLLIYINAASFFLFAFFYILFFLLAYFSGITQSTDIFHFFKAAGYLPVSGSLIFLAALLGILLLHELIHALFFYIYTGEKPVIGYKGLYAYAGAPGWYIKKKYFMVITLSPVVLITLFGFAALFFLTPSYQALVFLLITLNAGGSAGDLWMSYLLTKRSSETYINDSGVASSICY